ncbi:MAG: VanZ like family protein [Planctomycetes bacterium ADurb.Bin401]|nr:MAG: VanZ like family protein [Planctomycetes bacterium ADurb.Bin401]
MKLTLEKKVFSFFLVLYWGTLLIITHIPVPLWVRKMGVSDKTMHFAAYLALGLLIWQASSFGLKANWRRLRPWIVSGVLFLYGIADELAQIFIAGRTMDTFDLFSDFLGGAAAMLIVTFTSGYSTAMILVTISPVFLPAIVKSKLIKQGSFIEEACYFAGFAIITACWVFYLTQIRKMNIRNLKDFLLFLVLPSISVLLVKLYALATDKPFEIEEIRLSIIGIVLTLMFVQFSTRKKFI